LRRIAGFLIGALLLGACATDTGGSAEDRLSVVAAFFPVADAAGRIGGDRVRVTNLTPAGAEPHDLELTTAALDSVIDADVVLYLGGGFQPALEDALDKAEGSVVDLLDGLELHAEDPHVWLDPVLWSEVAEKIEDAFADATDAERGDAYRRELADLDEEFEDGLASCERDLVVTSHAAFTYMTKRYGLKQEAISGISPEAEPDPQRLAELADLVRHEDVTTIFTETLVSPDVARSLAREAGVRTDVLDPLEGEPDGGYFDGMRSNLGALQKALGCR
jgi:zinc transport system substrate-binding protein